MGEQDWWREDSLQLATTFDDSASYQHAYGHELPMRLLQDEFEANARDSGLVSHLQQLDDLYDEKRLRQILHKENIMYEPMDIESVQKVHSEMDQVKANELQKLKESVKQVLNCVHIPLLNVDLLTTHHVKCDARQHFQNRCRMKIARWL